jgi:hypothetical protein
MNTTTQTKLTKSEWESIESPVSEDEKDILQLIRDGYSNTDIRYNKNISLFSYAKLDRSSTIENYLYTKFLKTEVDGVIKIIRGIRDAPETLTAFRVEEINIKRLKSADQIRLENMNANIEINKPRMIEYIYIGFLTEMFRLFAANKIRYAFYLYSLIQLRNIHVPNKNTFLMEFIDLSITYINGKIGLSPIISGACDFIEKNPNLFKYGDLTLYDHQKRIFDLFKRTHTNYYENDVYQTNLVLYIAPTGTGKTLTPIGLSADYRIIFVCAARHVGMALAKSAISVQKCVAFAFGCETASDIRLHNLSALTYKINARTGGIGKIDNSNGRKVEIMICDAQSYLVAMYYMLSFNQRHDIITYWDEPTIGMDYETHPLHEITHRNWSENQIPNMVLSSATLPKHTQIFPVINDFRAKFPSSVVTTIESYDCNKSISLLNKNGVCVCPHLLYEDYRQMVECVDYCKTNMTLLRYFDLAEVVRFICYLDQKRYIPEDIKIDAYFDNDISKITMNSLKIYYLNVIENMDPGWWLNVYRHMTTTIRRKFDRTPAPSVTGPTTASGGKSLARTASVSKEPSFVEKAKAISQASGGILFTTADAHTLTDGPTIYLTENIGTIGNFYIQQSNIPPKVFETIMNKIYQNNAINEEIAKLEAIMEDLLGEEAKKEKKMSKNLLDAPELCMPAVKRINEQIDELKSNIKPVVLDSVYIPNTVYHQQVWTNDIVETAFVPVIDQDTAKKVMELTIDDRLKVLLLLGIGTFDNHKNDAYTEMMKKLANNKQLLMIVASSDYIYGTNYQFCHEIIGKDLTNMSQQKTIQALGRVGRNNIQQEYTPRFRDDAIIKKLFEPQEHNIEADMMCRLLRTEDDDE